MQFRARSWVTALCGVMLAAASTTATAETVTFSTSFAVNHAAPAGAVTVANIAGPGPTFTLVGTTQTLSGSRSDIAFGSLLFNGDSQSAMSGGSYNFTLTLKQTIAGSASTSTVGGVVSWINGLAKVDFAADAPIQLGSFSYMPDDIKQSFQSDAGTATITGDVSAAGQVAPAPVPAAVWGGVALCGLIAAFKMRRNSSAAGAEI